MPHFCTGRLRHMDVALSQELSETERINCHRTNPQFRHVRIFLTSLSQPAFITDDMLPIYRSSKITYEAVDQMARSAGTGKASFEHNYTRLYVDFFEKYRLRPVKLLEIGIFDGASAKFWEQYFPLAELHFMDITAERIKYYSSRSHYHFLSQADVNVSSPNDIVSRAPRTPETHQKLGKPKLDQPR